MKKLFTIACALVLGSVISFAQAGSTQTPPAGSDTGKTDTAKTTKGKKHHHHKGGKKSKKGSTGTTTPPPK